MEASGASFLDHAQMREAIADAMEQWAEKFDGVAGGWMGNTLGFHSGASLAIVAAHTHGLLDHELVITERITAKLAKHRAETSVNAAIFVFHELKHLIENPGFAPRPAVNLNGDAYKRDAELCRRIAQMIRAGGGSSSNDGRDGWMYKQKLNGVGHTKIRLDLEKQAKSKGWETLETDQAVGRAIDRYCDRRGLEKLRRKGVKK